MTENQTPRIIEVTKYNEDGSFKTIVEYSNGVRYITDHTEEIARFMANAKNFQHLVYHATGNYKNVYS